MSLLSVKDFANAVGVKEATLRKHIQRGKVIKCDNGEIDTENSINISYIVEQTKGAGLFKSSHTVEVKQVKEEKPKETKRVSIKSKEEQLVLDLDMRKRIAEAEKMERDSELKRVQLEKMAGNLLPVEVVERILVINLQSIFNNFESELTNMASIYITDRILLADAVKELKQILSNSIGKAKEDSEAEIENAINEYRDIRSRGERK